MPRNILIIDKFLSSRALLRHYLRAELNDCQLRELYSLEEGLPLLAREQIHIAILNDRLPGLENLLRDNGHSDIPSQFVTLVPSLIILTMDRPDHVSRLQEAGFHHFLATPFTPAQLAAQVEFLAPAKNLRSHPRFHLPGTEAQLHLGEWTFPSQVINVSRNGILCELTLVDPFLVDPGLRSFSWEVLHHLRISVRLPDALHHPPLQEMPCRLVGIKVLQWHDNHLPNIIRVEVNLVAPLTANLEELARDLLTQHA